MHGAGRGEKDGIPPRVNLDFGLTNLRDYYNRNFYPNDTITFGVRF